MEQRLEDDTEGLVTKERPSSSITKRCVYRSTNFTNLKGNLRVLSSAMTTNNLHFLRLVLLMLAFDLVSVDAVLIFS